MNQGARRIIIIFIKAAIAAISVWFIYQKVIAKGESWELSETIRLSVNDAAKRNLLIAILLLMLVNWFLETAKWKLLLEYIHPSGWLKCFRSVMSGVTVSILTPNRIGEFAGRVLHLEGRVRINAAIASIIGSMNQLLITILAGCMGLIASINLFVKDELYSGILIMLLILLMCLSAYIYFRIPGLTGFIRKFIVSGKLNLYASVFEKFSTFTLIKLSCLSAARYLVFSIQFVLMLHWFDIFISWQDAFKAITVMYLSLAIVPTIALSELTIRGSVALFFFAAYTSNSSGILAASSMIWLINLVVPALAGALFAFYIRFNR